MQNIATAGWLLSWPQGNMCIDEQVLRKAGVEDFTQYDYIMLGDTVEERLQNILANWLGR